MVVAIIALHYAAQKLGLPPSVALLAGGAFLAFLPGLPTITIDPELVLVIFPPPRLLDGTWSIALSRLRRHMIGITSFEIAITLVGRTKLHPDLSNQNRANVPKNWFVWIYWRSLQDAE